MVVTEDDEKDHEHHPDAWDKHRARFAPRRIKVHGKTLAQWASQIIAFDEHTIRTALDHGLAAGESNTEIAHRVIGSTTLRGINGATEQTRQHILRLGKGYLRARRMSGTPENGSKGH